MINKNVWIYYKPLLCPKRMMKNENLHSPSDFPLCVWSFFHFLSNFSSAPKHAYTHPYIIPHAPQILEILTSFSSSYPHIIVLRLQDATPTVLSLSLSRSLPHAGRFREGGHIYGRNWPRRRRFTSGQEQQQRAEAGGESERWWIRALGQAIGELLTPAGEVV